MHLLDACALEEPVGSLEDAEAFIGRICFKLGPPELVGVELEWHVHDAGDRFARPSLSRLTGALARWISPGAAPTGRLPRGSTVTLEPGGQVEISTSPQTGVRACIEAARADAAVLRAALTEAGLTTSGTGLDPLRAPARVLFSARYDAMERYFDRHGAAGRTMMCSTAAVQPALDAGADDYADRWHTLHAVGPALLGAFANSPLQCGRPTGWMSSRYRAWLDIDPARTCPPRGDDPRSAYARFALAAPLLCVRKPGGRWTARPHVRFADWLADRGERRPTFGDLAYHLTTLFPPVRPQGYYEIRYLDALPDEDWIVPLAVLSTLSADPAVRAAARAAAEPARDRWLEAARSGPRHPGVARAAGNLLTLATARLADDPDLQRRVADFHDRYTARGRCPADTVLEEYA